MKRVAIVSPVKFLDRCKCTTMQVCYATIAYDNPQYLYFYKQRKLAGDTVILDQTHNPVRRPFDRMDFVQIMRDLRPDIVVLPSHEFATDKTQNLIGTFLQTVDLSGMQTVGVLQGRTLEELKECYRFIRDRCNIVGFPTGNELAMSRTKLLQELDVTKPYMFLELHKSVIEEAPMPSKKLVCLTTSMPIRLAYVMRLISEPRPVPPALDFHQQAEPSPVMVERNISDLLKLF